MAATCAACGADQPAGARFCHLCGAPAVSACHACGAELVAGARFCSECGSPQAGAGPHRTPHPSAATPVSERKVTSVLFADLAGFTPLSERLDQEEVRDLLSRYFDDARRIVQRYGGTVEKFIGDAVMAVWGVPTAHEDDAERAVRAGLELVQAVQLIGEDVAEPALALRVGIVTGEVAVTIGAEQQGMVAGDAVNTASRVQGVAEPGQVWVDETTRLLTSASITFVDVGSHRLKGKTEPVPLWQVRAVVAAVGGQQRADGLESPLVGRDRELRLVKELFHATEENGRPSLVVVNGEAGVGKSRLGWELEKYVDGLSALARWHTGRCLAYGEGVAFWPIADAVRGRLGLVDSDPDADPVEALDAGLARYVPDPDEAAWLRPRMLALLGRAPSAGHDRDDLFAAWRTFFERVLEDRPVLTLLIDDAHQADEGTVQFVEHLVANAEAPVFVMLMARPGLLERWPQLATNRRATVLHLSSLEPDAMAELLDGLVSGLPEAVRAGLVERAEGVPLYAVETVRSLIDRDLVVPRGGVYVLPDPAALDLASVAAPASLQALVAARLDGLSAAQRRVVADASVLGTTFGREAIGALADDVDDLDELLASLCRVEILRTEGSRLSAEFGQFQFVQSVVRQVAYGILARRDRKQRHLAVAAYLESLDDPGADHAPMIAQHYLDALDCANATDDDVDEVADRAVANLTRAARRASLLGSPTEALRHLESGLARVSEDGKALTLHLEAAWAANAGGDAEAAESHALSAAALAEAAGDRLALADAVAARAEMLTIVRSDNRAALTLAEPHWLELREVPGAEPVLLRLLRPISNARLGLNLPTVDIDLARAELAERVADPTAMVAALGGLGVGVLGTAPTVGKVLISAAIELARAEQRPAAVARGLANLSSIELAHGVERALEYCREAVPAAKKSGDVLSIVLSRLNHGIACYVAGEWDELSATSASDAFAHAGFGADTPRLIEGMVAAARGTPVPRVDPAYVLGIDDEQRLAHVGALQLVGALRDGDPAAVDELARAVTRRTVVAVGFNDDSVLGWPVAVEAALACGHPGTAAELLEPVESRPSAVLPVGFRAHLERFRGHLARAAGDEAEAEERLRTALAAFDAWGSKVYAARAAADLARLLEGAGRFDEAGPLRGRAVGTFRALGAHAWLAELGVERADSEPPTRPGTARPTSDLAGA